MGTEYYLLKPEKKETFYLGKHFTGFSNIPNATYHSIESAAYPNYEDWDDFFWNTLRENWEYFLNCDLTLEQASDVIHEIYDWCVSDKVIFDNDCSSTAHIWAEWKETGDITKILERIHNTSTESTSIQEYLEENACIIFDNPKYTSAIIGVTNDNRVAYDYEKIIDNLMARDKISYEEAIEFFDYNIAGSLPPSGTNLPIVLYGKDTLI
jgi:hypothetical protein